MTWELDDNLINLEDSIGDATQVAPVTQTRTTNIDTSGIFNPIKVFKLYHNQFQGACYIQKEIRKLQLRCG